MKYTQTNWAGDDEAALKARSQNAVRVVIACRDALAAYRAWVATGVQQQLPPQPTPTHPQMWSRDADAVVDTLRKELAGGEISTLRDTLMTGECSWVPAVAGKEDGPTIPDAVKSVS